jgi:hypothetical protein
MLPVEELLEETRSQGIRPIAGRSGALSVIPSAMNLRLRRSGRASSAMPSDDGDERTPRPRRNEQEGCLFFACQWRRRFLADLAGPGLGAPRSASRTRIAIKRLVHYKMKVSHWAATHESNRRSFLDGRCGGIAPATARYLATLVAIAPPAARGSHVAPRSPRGRGRSGGRSGRRRRAVANRGRCRWAEPTPLPQDERSESIASAGLDVTSSPGSVVGARGERV